MQVEYEQLNQYRFYKLEPIFQERCTNFVDDMYNKDTQRLCGGSLWLNMKAGSVNLRCKHSDCFKEYDIIRVCSACGRQHIFEDITCDTCEPHVINITTWKVSIEECNKAIKKINRAFKQDLIKEEEWEISLKIQTDERAKCELELKKVDEL